MVQWATEINVCAERRFGEILRGGATLRDLGLTRTQSSQYPELAAMPAEHFENPVKSWRPSPGKSGIREIAESNMYPTAVIPVNHGRE